MGHTHNESDLAVCVNSPVAKSPKHPQFINLITYSKEVNNLHMAHKHEGDLSIGGECHLRGIRGL